MSISLFVGGSSLVMDTKWLIINTAKTLFQQKGYKSVGLNEILKECKITKGALYHHFPNGKEELLITCLHSMNEEITTNMEDIFRKSPNTQKATEATIDKLVVDFEREGTITGYTFTSIVREMASLSEPVNKASSLLFDNILRICSDKLMEEGFSQKSAHSISILITAAIEGGIILCLAQRSSEPLKLVSASLPNLIKEL